MRADAGSQIGFGHLMRTASLAAILIGDFDCSIVCRCDAPSVRLFADKVIEASGADRLDPDVADTATLDEYNEAFIGLLSRDAVAVLDNYFYGVDFQRRVRKASRALVCIDDMPDRRFDCDVLYTPSPYSRQDFSLPDHTRFYGGVEWALLRSPFLEQASFRKTNEISRLVISMGGADPLSLADKLFRVVSQLIPEAGIDVIAGPTAVVGEAVNGVVIHRNVDADTIRNILDRADLGIFPSSTGSIEAMARKLPVAAGFYADNQLQFYRKGLEGGWFYDLGDLRDPENEIKKRLRRVLDDYDPRHVPNFDFSARKNDIVNIFNDLWKIKNQGINA